MFLLSLPKKKNEEFVEIGFQLSDFFSSFISDAFGSIWKHLENVKFLQNLHEIREKNRKWKLVQSIIVSKMEQTCGGIKFSMLSIESVQHVPGGR